MALLRKAGTAYVKVDGIQLALQGGLTINFGTVVREPMMGMDGPHGFKETPMMPSIEASFTKGPEISLATLSSITDSTVTAECTDGTVFVLSEAFQSGELAFNAAEGTYSATFHGRNMTEI
ncbi:phage tail tube protein [Roseomonas sp. F4]